MLQLKKIDTLRKKDVDISNLNDLTQAQKGEIIRIKSDFVCDKCDYKAENLKSFLTHLTKKHQLGEFRNMTCNLRCQNYSEIKLHNTEMHKEKSYFLVGIVIILQRKNLTCNCIHLACIQLILLVSKDSL